MKAIELTEKHKVKLLKMCKVLFPELEAKSQKGYNKWCKIHGEDEREDGFWMNGANNVMCSYPIDYDYHIHLLGTKKNPSIHWFEFCVTHLRTKMKLHHDDMFLTMNPGKNTFKHPIDYLYTEFKT